MHYVILTQRGERRRVLIPRDLSPVDVEAFCAKPPKAAWDDAEVVGSAWPYAEQPVPPVAPVAAIDLTVIPAEG